MKTFGCKNVLPILCLTQSWVEVTWRSTSGYSMSLYGF